MTATATLQQGSTGAEIHIYFVHPVTKAAIDLSTADWSWILTVDHDGTHTTLIGSFITDGSDGGIKGTVGDDQLTDPGSVRVQGWAKKDSPVKYWKTQPGRLMVAPDLYDPEEN